VSSTGAEADAGEDATHEELLEVVKVSAAAEDVLHLILPTILAYVSMIEEEEEEDEFGFLSFGIRHKRLLNILIRADPSLLSESFSTLVDKVEYAKQLLDFDNKRVFFREAIDAPNPSSRRGERLSIRVRRSHVFEDSFQQLRHKSPAEMRGRMRHGGEEGIDASGLTRDWYDTLAKEMFNENYVLFTRSAISDATYQPSENSYVNLEHLSYFEFVGKIIGKAVYDGQALEAYFTRAFYKHILGVPVTLEDMQAYDPEFHASLLYLLDHPVEEAGLDMQPFTAVIDEFGAQKVVPLKEGGEDVFLTDDNKEEYVQLVIEFKLAKAISSQIAAFLKGFNELIPASFVSIFTEKELELLISGLPVIDVADMRANTEYGSGFEATSQEILWFWEIVESWDQEHLAKLVQFVTGTSRVPLAGFAALQGMSGITPMKIVKAGDGRRGRGGAMPLPRAHSCFNSIDLYPYPSKEVMEEKLMMAVEETSGFGFA